MSGSLPPRAAGLDGLHVEPDEPLAESAPLAWMEAPRRCVANPETGHSCAAYHRVWQFLRLLGIMSSTRTNTRFLVERFREYAQTGRFPRALISATADYSILAHLKHAYAAEGAALDATVIDRCETAVFLNQWYSARYQFPVTTECANILDYRPERSFDLVCTHNFLSRFDPEARCRLVAQWCALLRVGGVVVTTQRVQPDATASTGRPSEIEARELSSRVIEAARVYQGRLELTIDELAEAAYQFEMCRRIHPIRTKQEITDLFETQGFCVELADEGGGPAERAQDRTPRRVSASSYRMRLVARRL